MKRPLHFVGNKYHVPRLPTATPSFRCRRQRRRNCIDGSQLQSLARSSEALLGCIAEMDFETSVCVLAQANPQFESVHSGRCQADNKYAAGVSLERKTAAFVRGRRFQNRLSIRTPQLDSNPCRGCCQKPYVHMARERTRDTDSLLNNRRVLSISWSDRRQNS